MIKMTTQSNVMSPRDFINLGLDHVAYIKTVLDEGAVSYAIHGADGTLLATLPDHDVAFAAVRQHDMEPVSVH